MQTAREEERLALRSISVNQLGLNPQVLAPTPHSCEQPSIPPWD